MFGGDALSVIVGGRGDNIIKGGARGGVFRSHGLHNITLAQAGNSILEVDRGFSFLIGGAGRNVFKVNGGYAVCDGSKAAFNVIELPGSIYDYDFCFNEASHIIVVNKINSSHIVVAIGVTKFNFSLDVSNYSTDVVKPAKALIPVPAGIIEIKISVADLLAANFLASGKNVLRKIVETMGCKAFDERGKDLTTLDESQLNLIQKAKVFHILHIFQ